MSFQFRIGESAGDGIRRMALAQTDSALAEIADTSLDHDETVHQLRKRCKKVRALLRLARAELDRNSKVYSRENACFRDAARSLSTVRDAEALLQTYDGLVDAFSRQSNQQRLQLVRNTLEERKQRVLQEAIDLDTRLDAVASTLREARERITDWPVRDSFSALAPGLERNYRQARRAMKTSVKSPGADNLHEWRKRVKYQLYHVRVLRPAWPRMLGTLKGELKHLGELLGDDHDLAVFTDTLRNEHASFRSALDLDALIGLANQRRLRLQAEAFPLGRRLYAEKPGRHVKRIARYWEAMQSDVLNHARETGRPSQQ